MKKSLLLAILLFIALTDVTANIQCTYYNITVGKSTYRDMQWVSIQSSGNILTKELVETNEKFIYQGDFEVEGLHMHTLEVCLMNDTVYKIAFYDHSLNIDNHELYQQWLDREKEKYAEYIRVDTSKYDTWIPDAEKTYIKRADGEVHVIAYAHSNNVGFEVFINRLELKAQEKEMNKMMQIFGVGTSEDKVFGVAGVKFGDKKESVRKVISSKSARFIDSDKNSLTFEDTKIGSSTFDLSHFYFREGKGLIAVQMYDAFPIYKKNEAKLSFDGLCASYKSKYTNYSIVKDEDDDKICICGAPVAEISSTTNPPIWITLSQELSKSGQMMIYVRVIYYGVNLQGLFDDEI